MAGCNPCLWPLRSCARRVPVLCCMVHPYRHATPVACSKAGCNSAHLVLKDLAASVERSWTGDRPGLNLRNAIRSEIVFGRTIKGTKNVPRLAEIKANRPDSDRRDHRNANGIRSPTSATLASLATGRTEHYWHPGDPDIMAIRRLLIAEIPADPALGQDCAICLGRAVHDTRDANEVYVRDEICPHAFHRSCIREWCDQCHSVGQDFTCPLCVRPHPPMDDAAAFTVPTVAVTTAGRAAHLFEQVALHDMSHGSTSSRQVAQAATTWTRKRPASDLCRALPDSSKGSLTNRRAVATRKMHAFNAGDTVEARWRAKQGGSGWYRGKITRVLELSEEAGGPARTYDVAFDDGDQEAGVLARHARLV